MMQWPHDKRDPLAWLLRLIAQPIYFRSTVQYSFSHHSLEVASQRDAKGTILIPSSKLTKMETESFLFQ